MSTAQVFQATRTALPGQASGGTLPGQASGGVNVKALAPQFKQFMNQYDQPQGRNWFSQEIFNLQGAFGAQHPELSEGDLNALGNMTAPGAASNQAPISLFPEGQRKSGGSDWSAIIPILAIAAAAFTGGGSLAALGAAEGGAAALGAGAAELGVGELAALGGGGWSTGGAAVGDFGSLLSELGSSGGADMFDPNAWGGFDAAQGAGEENFLNGGENFFDGGGSSGPLGGTEFTPPGAEGVSGDFGGSTSMGGGIQAKIQNLMQNNPWLKQAFGAGRGAMNNRDNPLIGAIMGLGNSFIPGTGGPFSNALGMGSGVMSMFQGMDQNRRMKGIANSFNSQGDPYASLRASAMSRLAALNSDPGGTLAASPGYKAGMDAITRQRAAMGQLGSGNLATALLDYGGNAFNQERSSALNQLGMAGDGSRQAMMQAQLASMTGAGNSGIMNGLATLTFGLNRMGL